MDRILLGILIGALVATVLAAAFMWLAPFIAFGIVAWLVYKVARHLRRVRQHPGHAEPMKRSAAPPYDQDLLRAPHMSDSFRTSGDWARHWK